ncbi:hypothetical protein ILUMI_02667 [Ignelater luminosus]|uniref:Transporter n=1 Tax=Ignelater luminosus TaxID=2038154 RepID=A0A8K0DG34_IGNLU|nr:hypothetical protein ILUMI_02667 [Ignelater luminosus]
MLVNLFRLFFKSQLQPFTHLVNDQYAVKNYGSIGAVKLLIGSNRFKALGSEATSDTKSDDVPERASWSKPIEFVLSCLGYAVGIGNVWRFPYLCYRNGGGAFLVAYLVMVVVMGMPIFLLELVIGQYSGMGPDQAFARIAPIFSGLGYCCIVVIFLVTIYYMVIIAWTVFYFFAAFDSDLGWGSCNNAFNTKGCYSALEDEKCGINDTYFNYTCVPVREVCREYGYYDKVNRTYCVDAEGNVEHISHIVGRILASQEYFNDYVLGVGDSTWESFGSLRWQLVLCLLLSWIIGYLCVIRGVKTSGKAVYFTALFPYVILTILVVRGVTLDGAWNGILVYITPKWEMLADAEVWGNAASQTFYSFGISCGSLITLASYNDFNNNCFKDALIVTAANIFTSIYAGLAIFAMLGFLANQMDLPVEEVATQGPGLAFVAYPEALLRIPLPQLWAALFFFMLFILGLGSQFAGIEAVSTTILDKWPYMRNHHSKVTLGICLTCFILAIPMCFDGGVYLFTLLEWNTASWAILLIGFAEVVSASWAYGCKRFLDNMKSMSMSLSKFSYWYWWTCWVILTPLSCLAVFAFQMIIYSAAVYEEYIFPIWADAIGILIGLATLAPMPVLLIYTCVTKEYSGCRWFRPTDEWGPQTSASDSIENLTDKCSSHCNNDPDFMISVNV